MMVGLRTNFRDPNLVIDIWLRQYKEEEKSMFEDWIKKSTSIESFGPNFGRPELKSVVAPSDRDRQSTAAHTLFCNL